MKKICVLVCAVIVTIAPAQGQGRRFITEKDLLKFTWIADPQISPDGSTVAFVRVTVNEKENKYESSLFAVPSSSGSESPRRLTSGTRDTAPRWAPDGKRIAFVRALEKDGKAQPTQIYRAAAWTAARRGRITELARGASGPAWSPDGTRIAFTSSTGVEDAKKSDDPKSAPERKSDVEVVTRAVYRANGNPGYVDNDHHSHIFTISVLGSDPGLTPSEKVAEPTQITDGEFDEGGIQWAPDGSTIYFVSTRVAEPYYEEKGDELYAVPAGGGAIVKVAAIEGRSATSPCRRTASAIAFVGSLRGTPIRSYSQSDLWVTETAPGSTPKNLTADYDFDIASGIGGDQAAPRGQNRKPIVWIERCGVADRRLCRERQLEPEAGRDRDREGRASHHRRARRRRLQRDARTRSKIAATLSTQTSIGDIAILDGSGGSGGSGGAGGSDVARGFSRASRRSPTSTTSSSKTSSRARRKRSGTRASTARTSRDGS